MKTGDLVLLTSDYDEGGIVTRNVGRVVKILGTEGRMSRIQFLTGHDAGRTWIVWNKNLAGRWPCLMGEV